MKKAINIFLIGAILVIYLFSVFAITYGNRAYALDNNNSTTVFVYPNGNFSVNIVNILKANGYIIVSSPQNANYVVNYGQKNPADNKPALFIVQNGNISSNILSVLQPNGYSVIFIIPPQYPAQYPPQYPANGTVTTVIPEPAPYPYPVPYPYPAPYPYYAYPYPDYLIPGIVGGIIIGGFLYHGRGFRGHR